ncbi:hypothetical protein U1Q18_036860 [Sarracenia purpurea var. burkii]
MNALDSPVEVMAFNYLSFGFLTAANNNIWAWVAVMTTAAAVSFWRIRASAGTGGGAAKSETRGRNPGGSPPPPMMLLNLVKEEEEKVVGGDQVTASKTNSARTAVDNAAEETTRTARRVDTVAEETARTPQVVDIAAAEETTRTARVVGAVEKETTRRKFTVYYEDDGEDELSPPEEVGEDRVGELVTAVGGGGGGGGEEDWCEGWKGTMRLRTGDMEWYRHQNLTVLDGNVVKLWDGCRRKTTNSCHPVVLW